MKQCPRCNKINPAEVHTCSPGMKTLEEFKELCGSKGSFKFLGWEIDNLPNWNSDWKTCVAGKGNTRIRDTETIIYKTIIGRN